MARIFNTTGRLAAGLGLAASILVWLLALPFCAAWFVLVSAFGPATERQARKAS
ncbi:MAG: hypothetical protein KKC14_13015 [Alphaproteobacteria bacterium]|nr:hypothetical protein [Alphaproteobacteria bacterium]